MARGQQPEIHPKDQLGLYLDRAEILRRTRLANTEFSYGVKYTWNCLSGPPSFNASSPPEPDSDDLRSYLVIFRQFFNNDEPIFQNKIYKLLDQCLTSGQLRDYLHQSRESWKRALREEGIPVNYTLKGRDGSVLIDQKDLTPEFVTDLYINEAVHSYIRNEEKRLLLKYMLPHERLLTRTTMFQFLGAASQEIANTRFIITMALRESHLDFSKLGR